MTMLTMLTMLTYNAYIAYNDNANADTDNADSDNADSDNAIKVNDDSDDDAPAAPPSPEACPPASQRKPVQNLKPAFCILNLFHLFAFINDVARPRDIVQYCDSCVQAEW